MIVVINKYLNFNFPRTAQSAFFNLHPCYFDFAATLVVLEYDAECIKSRRI